jgi:UDP-glucose 4-epimerase
MAGRERLILVTGGAGYIGSHTVRMMHEEGYRLVVLDNLVYGHREAILSEDVGLIVGEMADEALIENIFSGRNFDAVMHFAAYASVEESLAQPGRYYMNNTAAPLMVLEAMRRHGCEKFIFSSTCAVYGNPDYIPIDENHPQNPINPYGRSKLMLEYILQDYNKTCGIRSVNLRYFNACGGSLDGKLGEDHDPETHLIPRILMAITGEIDKVTVYGTDYDTPDGTGIRDYIHVLDLARAHIKALEYLNAGGESVSCNLGTGRGVSVREIISRVEMVTGKVVPWEQGERRAGDPPQLVASPLRAREVLNWEARYRDVGTAIETAWRWINQLHGGRYGR